jgi:hypothetical protein
MEAVVLNGILLYLTSDFIVMILPKKYSVANAVMNLRVTCGELLD